MESPDRNAMRYAIETDSLKRNAIRQRAAVQTTLNEIDAFQVALTAEGHEPNEADGRIIDRLYTKLKRQRQNLDTTERQIVLFARTLAQTDAFQDTTGKA